MLKKNLKKSVSLILLVSLIASMVGGCGSKTSTTTPKATTAAADAVNKDPITIKVLSMANPQGGNTGDSPWLKNYTAKTGITLDLLSSSADSAQYSQKLNLLLASGDIPDIIVPSSNNDLQSCIKSGQFEPLNDLIDKYGPNVKKYFQANPAVYKDAKTDDGKVWLVPGISAVKTSHLWIMRQDWLDRLSLKQPETLDDMYNVLKAMKEKDPNGNGKADEIPLAVRNGRTELNSAFFSAFGLDNSWQNYYSVDNNKVKFIFTDPKYKEALTYMSKLYKDGLLDKEFATVDTNLWQQRMSTELTGVTYDVFVRISGMQNLITKANPSSKVNMIGVAPLNDPNGKKWNMMKQSIVVNGPMISTSSKYKKEIMSRLLDYFYTQDGSMAKNFGILGDTYTMENGQPKYTDKIVKDPTNGSIAVMFSLGKRELGGPNDIRYENASQDARSIKYRDEATKYIMDGFPAAVSYTDDEQKIRAAKFNEIKTYIESMEDKFIMGAEPISNFDAYVKKVNDMGLQDVVNISQAAYDRYQKR